MACNADFVQYIVDQCTGAGDITALKMMGDDCKSPNKKSKKRK